MTTMQLQGLQHCVQVIKNQLHNNKENVKKGVNTFNQLTIPQKQLIVITKEKVYLWIQLRADKVIREAALVI